MKHALVTGAAKRLGREMALHLAQQGYSVGVHYAGSANDADQTVHDIVSTGGTAVALQADLLDDTQTGNLIARATDALGGPLTVLINNASIFEYDTLPTADRTSWDRHFQSNLRAPFILSQDFAAQVPKGAIDELGEPIAQSLIVNMIDQRIRKLTPEFMTYTLAKSALWTLTQTGAQALAPDIRVNAIGPGPTIQGMRQSVDHFNLQRASTILERGSNPSDIVGALNYFLNAPAVTGQILCVDGGQHLTWQTRDIQGVE